MNKLRRKIIHTLDTGEVLIEFPDLNQAVLIGRPNPAMRDAPLTAAVITDLKTVQHYAKTGLRPSQWHRLIRMT
jgi:hypothetical protein